MGKLNERKSTYLKFYFLLTQTWDFQLMSKITMKNVLWIALLGMCLVASRADEDPMDPMDKIDRRISDEAINKLREILDEVQSQQKRNMHKPLIRHRGENRTCTLFCGM